MPLRPLSLLLLAGCVLGPAGGSQTGTTDGTTGATTGATTTSGGGPTTADVTTAPTTTGAPPTGTSDVSTSTGASETATSSVGEPDVGAVEPCDFWAETCPEGQKCMPYGAGGEQTWTDLKCVPVVPAPDGAGEPCSVVGSVFSGEDSCDKHMMCWDVDPDTLVGTCVAMCTGSPDDYACEDPGASCVASGNGVLALCLTGCDPLLQDCDDGELCVPGPTLDKFLCVPDVGGPGGQTFDPCEFVDACDKGLFCLDSALADECDPMAANCCTPVCDTTAPNTCPGQGQECLPWFEQGQAPPAWEHIGVCGLPQ